MGTLKFYRPMQAFWEVVQFGGGAFGTPTNTITPTNYPRYCNATDGLSGYLFSTADLTNASSYKYVAGNLDDKAVFPFLFSSSSSNASTLKLFGSSHATHDSTRNSISDKVADVTVTARTMANGVATIAITVTNTDNSNPTTVKAIEAIRRGEAGPNTGSSSVSGCYFLGWAYYLDQSEWITLEAGETKSVTIDFQFPDLTQ